MNRIPWMFYLRRGVVPGVFYGLVVALVIIIERWAA